jgi:hypothetical protein
LLPRAVCAPDHESELVQLVASVDDQLSVTGLLTEALVADRAKLTVGVAAGGAVAVEVELLPPPPHATRLATNGTSAADAAPRRTFLAIVQSPGDTGDIGTKARSLSLVGQVIVSKTLAARCCTAFPATAQCGPQSRPPMSAPSATSSAKTTASAAAITRTLGRTRSP